MKAHIWYLFMILFVTAAHAQHQAGHSPAGGQQTETADSLRQIFQQKYGTFQGHVRSFFMSTTNHNDYPNYYALAVGAGLAYYSPIIKNFQIGFSGFTIYNLASSSLHPAPPFNNRYEIQLFDITNPDNHSDMDRLEDLYLRFYLSATHKSYLQVGKFHLQTPLVNPQDGRMRPNLQEGLWAEWNNWKKVKIQGGWLWRNSPRGTIQWFSIGQSVGIYPNGRAVDGTPANYRGQATSNGLFIGGINYQPHNKLDVQVWNYLAHNLFNTALFKTEWKKQSTSKEWLTGVQLFYQHSLADTSLPVENQYFAEGTKSVAVSLRTGFTHRATHEKWFINYTRITAHGRFQFPREWGVEPFYTFMPRERNEGAGNVHAVMLQNTRDLSASRQLTLHTQAGAFMMPSVTDYRLNKYAMPAYYHLNARLTYRFKGALHGLQADVLYSYKNKLTRNLEVMPLYYHNKIDTHLLSIMVDYYF
jgi:hypothetical protein